MPSTSFLEHAKSLITKSPTKITESVLGTKRGREKNDTGGCSTRPAADFMNRPELRLDSPTPASNNSGQLLDEDSMLEDNEGSLLNTEQEEARRLLFDTTPTPHQHFDHLENIVLGIASNIQDDIGTILTWVQDTAASANETNENMKILVTINAKLQEEVATLKGQNSETRTMQKRILEEVDKLRKSNSELTCLLTNMAPTQGARQPDRTGTVPTHKTTTTFGPTFRLTLPSKAPTMKPAARPTDAHHPSRLVVRFIQTGVKEDDKEDP
ncbi:hypothetical protein E1B28_002612 [Marasmius oreades]|uniref:Uncharacterized protein n=1 Tax=Marasmius oreades TaxID=181124 RepID=A0A9P7UKY2_9AGAR|nr:uncharacterized protein E1B28_002612 [Marasmius oreades]KAG7086672.1 hypothetical protein E1B28_002612 [Marasmius oreades]